MIASGGANPFASLAGGVSALWGPLHGGANMAVIKMLNEIHEAGDDGSRFIESASRAKPVSWALGIEFTEITTQSKNFKSGL